MSSEALEIRKSDAGDAEQIWLLVRDFATTFRPERPAFERALLDLLDRTDTLILVAVAEPGTIVGYLLGTYHETLFANGPVTWIEELMVSASRRRQASELAFAPHSNPQPVVRTVVSPDDPLEELPVGVRDTCSDPETLECGTRAQRPPRCRRAPGARCWPWS